MKYHHIPIIAIDGTASSGKGTISYKLAQHFGFHYLNSGALYRLTAHTAITRGISLSHKEAIVEIAKNIDPVFRGKEVIVNGIDIWPIISSEGYGSHASVIAPIKEVREAIFELQRKMIKPNGLVADGRAMGTDVFKDAIIKIFFDADITVRAERRYKDELKKNSGKTLEYLINEIRERDHKDMTRDHGKLIPADDAFIIDTTNMTIDEVLSECVELCNKKLFTINEITKATAPAF